MRSKGYNTDLIGSRAGEARQGNAQMLASGKRRRSEEPTMKTYSKPTLKKHAALKQITFSSH